MSTNASEIPSFTEATPEKGSRKKLVIAGVLTGVLVAALGAGAAGFSHYYSGRVLPGTTIAGQDVSGMTSPELLSFLDNKTQGTEFTFTVAGQTVKASHEEMGLAFNNQVTADELMAKSNSFGSQIKSLFVSSEAQPDITFNAEKFKSFAEKLALKAGPVVKQASIKSTEDGGFTTTPAVVGKAVDVEKLQSDIATGALALQSTSVTVEVSDVQPTITEEDAKATIAAAKALAERDVTVTDGIDLFTADLATKSSWVVVPESKDQTKLEAPRFDRERVKKWVDQTAKDSNVEAQPTYNNVNATGKILIEGAKPGRKGYTVNNAAKVLDGIMAASEKGEPYAGEFDYDEVPPPVENRQVLPGAENMAYPAAEGEKWLEINLGNNSVSAYVGTDLVHGPVAIVPGSPGHETVTGLFHVYLKYVKQDMGCTPEWPYCAKDVPWVSYFHGSYAFHGAPWQDTFGWNGPGGSHGCINMPVHEAQWVHQWSEMGTPVISHY